MVGGLHQERQLKVCDVICNLSIVMNEWFIEILFMKAEIIFNLLDFIVTHQEFTIITVNVLKF